MSPRRRYRPRRLPTPRKMGLLAVLMIPLLLLLHAPLLAAFVPGALLTLASIDSMNDGAEQASLAAEQVVRADDLDDLQRIEGAEPIVTSSRRV